ncbi:TPA: DNA/RNA non-specific endonuclease [Streptococcus suis]
MTPDKLEGDHAGHIFGDLFGGSPELDNLLSQAKDVNLKEYRRIERDWADALRSNPPKKVEADIKINYDGISKRPISFEVNYKIDGEPYSEILKNINRGDKMAIFEDQFMEIQIGMVSLAMEYVNCQADAIYIYGISEKEIISYNVFFKIKDSVVKIHKVNSVLTNKVGYLTFK